jgi:o-succinylbenzoate---CoA ligase
MERAELEAVVKQTGCAEETGGFWFLCDPQWREAERRQVDKLRAAARASTNPPDSARGWLCIATGGTSGEVRFARHDQQTMTAAVTGLCEFFKLDQVNAVDVLPGYHVSGFMSRVRCAATGGHHVPCDWRRLEAGERPMLSARDGSWVISLVPTQLQRLMVSPGATDWLRSFKLIFVGGGPTWPDLTRAAAELGLPIALTYGMTETAAMVAAIAPDDFRKGERVLATPLPHAKITVGSEGAIVIEGRSVSHGYFPEWRESQVFETEDLGRIDERGRLQIFGRKDAVIITGGKKVQPQEVEAALRATGQFVDVAVIGVPDPEWGESVVACFPKPETAEPNWTTVERALERSLAAYKRPKRFVAITDWPRNAHGKLSRTELAQRVARAN